jgi:hypothetical protein
MTTTDTIGGASSIGASSSSTTSSPNNSSNNTSVDGKAVAVSLAVSLLELSLTLTASYLFSKWIAKIIQQNNAAGAAGGGADGMDGFEADNGSNSKNGGTTVVQRLENLLISRYNITLNAMMEEQQLVIDGDDNDDDDNDEEKKEEYSASSSTSFIGRLLSQDMAPRATAKKTTKLSSSLSLSTKSSNQDKSKSSSAVRYANALRTALTKQHEYSLSYLTTLTPYEIAIAQNNCIDPSGLSITFRDVGGMDDIKSEVYDLVVLPLLRPDLFVSDSGLVAPPKGILLYG